MSMNMQRGATMISLLVGMVVSMLAILASLSMFHNLVRTSTEAKADARMEGDISLGVLRLDQELLAAGFNVDRAPGAGRNQDFALANNLVGNTPTSRVVWRLNDGGNWVCRRAVSTFNIPQLQYTLELFEANAGLCLPGPAALPDLNDDTKWTRSEQLVSIRLQALDAGTPVTLTRPLIEFSSDAFNDRACMPFGAAAPLAPGAAAPMHPNLRIHVFDTAAIYAPAPNAANAAGPPRPDLARTHTLCLVNITL
ncbi:MAG TPA: hypothetical protein PKC70_12155 [Cellvibrionaceae bacterium]|nr:hypothetical protein [Cellvibrionaceae bacterium]